MEFKEYFIQHAKRHPYILPQDVVKFCYQAAFGAEHLLSDIEAARRYFGAEFEAVDARDGELIEELSDEVCRVDIGVWKARGLPKEALFDAFAESSRVKNGGREVFLGFLDEAEASFGELDLTFSLDEWRAFLEKYAEAGMPAVHHSGVYREKGRPSYRVVNRAVLGRFI